MTYEIIVTPDLGTAVESVGVMIDEINNLMVSFGANDRISVLGDEFCIGTFDTTKELSPDELDKVKKSIEEVIKANEFKVRLLYIRRRAILPAT
jgi:hypothetical protein